MAPGWWFMLLFVQTLPLPVGAGGVMGCCLGAAGLWSLVGVQSPRWWCFSGGKRLCGSSHPGVRQGSSCVRERGGGGSGLVPHGRALPDPAQPLQAARTPCPRQ